MRPHFKLAVATVTALCSVQVLFAQDLAPRAYVITPVHSNAVTVTYSFTNGGILFDNTVPITDANGRINFAVVSYYHSLNFFGRSANITASLPYAVGKFRANVMGSNTRAYRSGMLDAGFRFSVNIKGGPAMPLSDFRSWKQKTLVGISFKFVAPTGQYDPTRLTNPGTNRWAFKPDFGLSQRWGHWILDTYGGVWLFTTNTEFFSHNQYYAGINAQSQNPISAFEGHVSYDLTESGTWVSLDGNYWYGGRTTLNGAEARATLQANSRIGATFAVRVSKHQSVKCSYSRGAYIRFGGTYQGISVAWQYSWLGKPR
jgi:hypothetical protein